MLVMLCDCVHWGMSMIRLIDQWTEGSSMAPVLCVRVRVVVVVVVPPLYCWRYAPFYREVIPPKFDPLWNAFSTSGAMILMGRSSCFPLYVPTAGTTCYVCVVGTILYYVIICSVFSSVRTDRRHYLLCLCWWEDPRIFLCTYQPPALPAMSVLLERYCTML